MSLPHIREQAVDAQGRPTAPFYRWYRRVEDALASVVSATPADTSNFLTKATTATAGEGIDIAGSLSGGAIEVALAELADSGVGAAIWKFTRDDYGRVEGTESATTDDLPEGATNLYFTDERAQDAVAAALAAGTHSGISFTYDDAGNKISATVSGGGGGSGAMTYIGNASLGAAATTLPISGLDLAADTCYFVVIRMVIATATAGSVRLFYNSDNTTTNYRTMRIDASNSGLSRTTGNNADIMVTDAIESGAIYTGFIRADNDGKARAKFDANRRNGTGFLAGQHFHLWDVASNPVGLTLGHTVANGLGAGTRIDVWKVDT